MYYFCYVSEHKVNQVIDQYAEGIVDSLQETHEVVGDSKASIGAKLLSLITGHIEWGKSERTLLAQELRRSVVSKLSQALRLIDLHEGRLKDLDEAAAIDKGALRKGTYWYVGRFQVVSYDDSYAHLSATMRNGCKLILACSMKYFSDMGNEAGRRVPHSGNVHFFKGKVDPEFTTVVYVVEVQDTAIYGTPLFLALPLDSDLKL